MKARQIIFVVTLVLLVFGTGYFSGRDAGYASARGDLQQSRRDARTEILQYLNEAGAADWCAVVVEAKQ